MTKQKIEEYVAYAIMFFIGFMVAAFLFHEPKYTSSYSAPIDTCYPDGFGGCS